MAKQLQHPLFKTLLASAAKTATGASDAFAVPLGVDTYALVVNATTVTGTSPTADFILQTSFDGTNYINLPLRSTQVTAAGVRHFIFKLGLGGNEVAVESPAAATGGTLAKNCVFNPAKMKLAWTIGGTNPSFTFALLGGFVPIGSSHE